MLSYSPNVLCFSISLSRIIDSSLASSMLFVMMAHLAGNILSYLNSALNPIILITRGT